MRKQLFGGCSETVKKVVPMKGLRLEVQRYYPVVAKVASVVCICLLALTLLMFADGCGDSTGQLPVLFGETDWQRIGLRGEVKSWVLHEVSWTEVFGSIKVASEITSHSTTFRKWGDQDESIYYDMNGKPKWKDEFTYNDDETWTGCISYKCINEDCTADSPQWSYKNLYDNAGRIYRVEGYDYDDAGKKLSRASWVHLYEYFEDEGKISLSSYDSDGKLQWKNVDRYNADGRIIESAHYDNNGTIKYSEKFRYDSQGNKIEWSRYDSDGLLEWMDKFKYDDNGNEVECANYDYRNKLMWRNVYLYVNDEELAHFDPNSSANMENRFDICGNWTVRVTLEENEGFGSTFRKVKEIEKRVLTYYSPCTP